MRRKGFAPLSGLATRFGFKIVAAMLLIAVIPLVTSVLLVDQVVGVSDSVAEGQMRRLAAPLSSAADAYRELFRARKRLLELRARRMVADPRVHVLLASKAAPTVEQHRAFAAAYDNVAALQLLDEKGRSLAGAKVRASVADPALRPVRVTTRWSAAQRLEVTFLTPRAPFDDFRALGKAKRSALEIGSLRQELASYYRVVFLIMFGAVLVVATAVGLVFARHTVRRVGLLVRATRSVAHGDLETQVALDARDELGELGDAFNEMVRQLKESRDRISYLEKIGAWQEVARRLAHQIKNPLTPIRLMVQQLGSAYDGGDERFGRLLKDASEIITEEVDGLRRLVDAFSTFAKLPSAKVEPIDLSTVVEDFLRSHPELAQQANLLWESPEETCIVQVDRMLIKHALFNLVENAVQAAQPAAKEALEVRLSVEVIAEGERVALSVADNGPGMDDATVRRVFEPYFTTKANGTGLGLAIAKKIVLEHGGTIDVAAEAGRGTTFTLVLPLATQSS